MKLKQLVFLLFAFSAAGAQPFAGDIAAFKNQDSISFPAPNQILFVGSSSFTLWKDVNDYFPGYKILNRAFGGSTLLDLIHYRYEVIFPYQPRQIVMYCGENDFASADTVTSAIVVERFKSLFSLIRRKYPETPFVYISMKPSPSRKQLMKKFEIANHIIEVYLKEHKNTAFINVFDKMLKSDGNPEDSIFLDDKLHMNKEGYAIWKKIIEPYLIK